MYAAVRNIMNKSEEDLRRIKAMGIDDLYVGIESAREGALDHLNKGNTAADTREQVLRLNAAGISHMDMLMLGAAGEGEAEKSALAAAALENETKPKRILINNSRKQICMMMCRRENSRLPARRKSLSKRRSLWKISNCQKLSFGPPTVWMWCVWPAIYAKICRRWCSFWNVRLQT